MYSHFFVIKLEKLAHFFVIKLEKLAHFLYNIEAEGSNAYDRDIFETSKSGPKGCGNGNRQTERR